MQVPRSIWKLCASATYFSGPVKIGVKIFRACECSPQRNRDLQLEFSTGKQLDGNCSKKFFYWKTPKKTVGKSFLKESCRNVFSTILLEKLKEKGSRKEFSTFFYNSRKAVGNSFLFKKLKENCGEHFLSRKVKEKALNLWCLMKSSSVTIRKKLLDWKTPREKGSGLQVRTLRSFWPCWLKTCARMIAVEVRQGTLSSHHRG